MTPTTNRKGERGSARLKFVVVLAILGAIAYAGYKYIPVAYQAYLFKDQMHQKVDAAVALGHTSSWVTEQLTKTLPDYDIPSDAQIETTKQNDRMEVHVQYVKPIDFPGYTYNYTFDETIKSTDFVFK